MKTIMIFAAPHLGYSKCSGSICKAWANLGFVLELVLVGSSTATSQSGGHWMGKQSSSSAISSSIYPSAIQLTGSFM